MDNLLALGGFTVIAVAAACLFGVLWSLLLVVGPVLLLAAYAAHAQRRVPSTPAERIPGPAGRGS